MSYEGDYSPLLMPAFTRATGIAVEVQTLPWTAAHEKLLTASGRGRFARRADAARGLDRRVRHDRRGRRGARSRAARRCVPVRAGAGPLRRAR
ncbi:hypothetical protein AB5I41_27125 [Sphingomonas sp. MMS24-JH45]